MYLWELQLYFDTLIMYCAWKLKNNVYYTCTCRNGSFSDVIVLMTNGFYNSSDTQPLGRVRPEAQDIARMHTMGTIAMLLSTQPQNRSSKYTSKRTIFSIAASRGIIVVYYII